MRFKSCRPHPADRRFTSAAVENSISEIAGRMKDKELAWLFANCLPNTLDTTVYHELHQGRPDTFVITGDIPAMWLRDSTAQVWPYLRFAKEDVPLRELLQGVLNRQVRCVLLDPYANAFEPNPAGISHWAGDHTAMKPGLHERKYELDSLCAVLRLSNGYFAATGDKGGFDADWAKAVDLIIETIRREQDPTPEGKPPHYEFARNTPNATDTLPLHGRGNPGRSCGLSRSPFRPSDDATILPYLIPSNAMAVVELRGIANLCGKVLRQKKRAAAATALADSIAAGIAEHAVVEHPHCGRVYAYEVDGFGSYYFMDDANVPSLLSLPYLGFCETSDPLYVATRQAVLSADNPYFSTGKMASGIGGPHVGAGHIWPMSIIMRALTSNDEAEVRACLATLKKTHAGTGFMHETFWKDDPSRFTRKWFAWANTLFGELILHVHARWPGML